MTRFDGKGVVVTGAAQGIGLGIVRAFLAEGAGGVAFDKNGPKVEHEAAQLGDRCVPFVGDVSVRTDCRRTVELCVERFGAIDGMCAHTGIAEPMPLLEMTEEHWHRHIGVNVDGEMYCAVEAAKAMIAANRPVRSSARPPSPRGSWRRRTPSTTSRKRRSGPSCGQPRWTSRVTASA